MKMPDDDWLFHHFAMVAHGVFNEVAEQALQAGRVSPDRQLFVIGGGLDWLLQRWHVKHSVCDGW